MTHQIDFLSAQKCSCLSRCMRVRIVVVKSDLSSVVGFPDFLWKTTGKQMVVYHSEFTVLRFSSDTIETCPKKQAIICLEVLRTLATFVGFDSS